MDRHNVTIECPNCKTKQNAEVLHTEPWYTYFHICKICEYMILESEWREVENE